MSGIRNIETQKWLIRMMEDLEDAFTIAYSREGRLQFLIKSSIRMASLGEAVEEHVRLVKGIPDTDACRARYMRELRQEALHLYETWGNGSDGFNYSRKEILDEFRRQLGSDYEQCLGTLGAPRS